MNRILLDYVFEVNSVQPIPIASTGFLKRPCVVAKPKAGQEANVGEIFECVTMAEVLARTDNTNAQELFDRRVNLVYVLLADDLALAPYLEECYGQFFTLLISDDFDDSDIAGGAVITPEVKASRVIGDITYTAIANGVLGNQVQIVQLDTLTDGSATVSVAGNVITINIEAGETDASTIAAAVLASTPASALVSHVVASGQGAVAQSAASLAALSGGSNAVLSPMLSLGKFNGVVGLSTQDEDFAKQQASVLRRTAFKTIVENGARSLFSAFGALLADTLNWKNKQYVQMPVSDNINDLGKANLYFDNRVSFTISDEDYNNRLGFFAAGGQAIVAPYIERNLILDMQGKSLSWFAANEPDYSEIEATKLEKEMQKVIDDYVERSWLRGGQIEIRLEQSNFVASGYIDVPTPKAMWKVINEMRQV